MGTPEEGGKFKTPEKGGKWGTPGKGGRWDTPKKGGNINENMKYWNNSCEEHKTVELQIVWLITYSRITAYGLRRVDSIGQL